MHTATRLQCAWSQVKVLDLSFNSELVNYSDIQKLATSLVKLNLSSNSLLQVLSSLTSVESEHSCQIPSAVWSLLSLQELDLSRNRISVVPPDIWKLKELQHLDLSHNRLTDLPTSLRDCLCLRTLDLSFNSFDAVPVLRSVSGFSSCFCLLIPTQERRAPGRLMCCMLSGPEIQGNDQWVPLRSPKRR